MCDCSNSLALHCLCRANWFMHDGDGGIYRKTYQTGAVGEVTRDTIGRWQTASPTGSLNFEDDTINLISNGDVIFAVGGNKAPGTGYRVAGFNYETGATLFNILVPGGGTPRSNGFTNWLTRLTTGPGWLDCYTGPQVGSADTSAISKARIGNDGTILRNFSSPLGAGMTSLRTLTHYSSGGCGLALNTGATQSGHLAEFNALGSPSIVQSVFSNGSNGGGVTARFGAIHYQASWRDAGGFWRYKHSTPWSAGEVVGGVAFTPLESVVVIGHEVHGGGVLMTYVADRYEFTLFGSPAWGAVNRLGFADALGNSWSVPLTRVPSPGVPLISNVPTFLFSDELAIWITFSASSGSDLNFSFPTLFPPGSQPGAGGLPRTFRFARDLSAVDYVTGVPSQNGTNVANGNGPPAAWAMQRLDCIAKAMPTQHKATA